MAWARSPWLTSMKYSFQDTQHLYIVMDFFPGGDLFSIIEKEEGLDETAVKFYLAEIASGLNDLHCLGFVHRDVKPENVLIAGSGHVRLVDFGVAARVVDGKVVSTYTCMYVRSCSMYVCICVCVCIYVCTYVCCIHTCIHCMHVCVCICTVYTCT